LLFDEDDDLDPPPRTEGISDFATKDDLDFLPLFFQFLNGFLLFLPSFSPCDEQSKERGEERSDEEGG